MRFIVARFLLLLFLSVFVVSCGKNITLPKLKSSNSYLSTDFVSTWRTNTSNETITLPLVGGYNYDMQVDWGDGTELTHITSFDDPEVSHTYLNAGDYQVKISGLAEAWSFNNSGSSKDLIIRVDNFGDLGWVNLAEAFNGCSNLKFFSGKGGNTSRVVDMTGLFQGAISAFIQDINQWDTSSVTSLERAFRFITANPVIKDWNTSSVTNMFQAFRSSSYINPDVANWDVSNVTNMAEMFIFAINANPVVDNWDTSSVTNISFMFRESNALDLNVRNWDVSNVSDMTQAFLGTPGNPDVSLWDTRSLVRLSNLFQDAPSANPDLSNWDFSLVDESGINYIFNRATSLTNENYSKFLIQLERTSSLSGQQLGNVSAQYNLTAASARENLVARGWFIVDGGPE